MEESDEVTTHFCKKCGQWMNIVFQDHEVCVDGVTITLAGFPLLSCSSCNVICLPDTGKEVIKRALQDLKPKGVQSGRLSPKESLVLKRYPYCKVEFLYSALDHDYIPGLWRPWNEGFLTPVFFNAAVLNKYAQDPQYRLDLCSDTYGSIIKGDEINIAFGINQSGKVLMWLGDLDTLPVEEQYYLRSENVESDHDVRSEFYDGQIGAVFTEPSAEHLVFQSRSELNQQCKEALGGELYKLPSEIGRTIEGLRRPVFWNENNAANAVESFNRILVEALDVDFLKGLLVKCTNKKTDGLKGMKLLEAYIGNCLGDTDARQTVSPFFVLNDFRLLVCHLRSDASRDEQYESINDRLGLERENRSLEVIYFALLSKLADALAAIR